MPTKTTPNSCVGSLRASIRSSPSRESLHAIKERFTVQLANTPGLLREAQRLRYQVFCLELRTSAEISRFGISKARRDLVGVNAGLLRPVLMHAVVLLSAELGITHLVAMMEPSLLRLLKGSGIHFNSIGNPIEYLGLRQCCYAKIDALLARVYKGHPEIWGVLTGGGTLWPAPADSRDTVFAA